MVMEASQEASQRALGGQQAAARRKSRKRLVWWILPLAIVLAVLVGGAIWLRGPIRLRLSEPYRMAFELVQKDPQVVRRLGGPVESARLLPFGSLDNREGTVNFAVEGPKGEATVAARARRISEQWGLTTLDVTFDDGQRVSVDVSSTRGGPAAPKFKPRAPNARGAQDKPKTPSDAGPDTETGLDTEIKIELPEIPDVPVR
jgi:hypothetical protein